MTLAPEPHYFPLGAIPDAGTIIPATPDTAVILPPEADRYAIRMAGYQRRALRWAARNPACVISHVTAAALHGLPADVLDLHPLHATLPRSGGTKRTAHMLRHAARLTDDEIAAVGPIRLTSPARTLVDIARAAEPWRAIAVADAALRANLLTSAQLTAQLGLIRRQPGGRRARTILSRADPLAESVGESRARLAIYDATGTTPRLQVDVRTPAGHFVGRVDMLVADLGLVIEFDGDIKYGRLLPPGTSALDVAVAQHKRQVALEALGLVVHRVIWADFDNPRALRERLTTAFRDAAASLAHRRVTAHFPGF